MFDSGSWMIVVIFAPLLGAVSTFLSGMRTGRYIAIPVSIATGLAALSLGLSIQEHGPVRHAVGGWSAPLGIDLYADGLSVVMVVMTATVGFVGTIYAVGCFHAPQDADANNDATGLAVEESFWPLWLFMWAALNALFLSGDIFNHYVTLELLTLSSVGLIALAGNREALAAALRYLVVALVGSLFYLLGVALIYSEYATVDYARLSELMRPSPASGCAVTLVTVGLALKTGLFPLHFWLPPAYATAPTPVTPLLAGLVGKASFYLLLRLWLWVFPNVLTEVAGHVLGAIAVLAILWGSVQALRQQKLGLLLAYSSVAQVGYLFLVFALATSRDGQALAWRGAGYLVISHACAKAAAFMAAGVLIRQNGDDRLDQFAGSAQRLPMTVFAFGLAGVSLIGLPPSGGFIAKWLLLNAALENGHWWIVAAILLGGLLTAGYVFRVIQVAFVQSRDVMTSAPVPRVMELPAVCLAVTAILLGFVAPYVFDVLTIAGPRAVLGGSP